MNNPDLYLLNRVFTIPFIDKMINGYDLPVSLFEYVKDDLKSEYVSNGDAITDIYQYMDKSYRNEYYYKNSLLDQLVLRNHKLYNTVALAELPISKSKADIVLINGKGIVYEIKTDLDNLDRLEQQINDYYKAFSYVYVVAGATQLQAVRKKLENTKTGIYEMTKSGRLIKRKKAYCNREGLCHNEIIKLLRKKEFESIIINHYKELPAVNDFDYYKECRKKLEQINIITLQKEAFDCLKKRRSPLNDYALSERVPYELLYYAYFNKNIKHDFSSINAFWGKTIGE